MCYYNKYTCISKNSSLWQFYCQLIVCPRCENGAKILVFTETKRKCDELTRYHPFIFHCLVKNDDFFYNLSIP